MNESTLNRMIREHKARIIWFLVFLILAVFVTALVFGTLKRSVQAQTYTKRVFACSYAQEGAEPVAHQHNDDCYENGELICTLPERELHTHGEECYGPEEKVLVCTLEEGEGHVHTDACYTEEPVLVCTLEESDGHVHSVEAGCYTRVQGDLICTNEDPEHVHTDECYTWEEVLTCEIPEGEGAHHHSEECYETRRILSCGKEEGEGAHTHDDTCYEIQKVLICDKEEVKTEHVHTVDCFQVVDMSPEEIHALHMSELPESDPDADVESPDVWESRFASVPLSGHWDRDLLKIAETQLGYTESQRNFDAVLDENGEGYTLKGWTRYGAWYGIPYGDWCAMFISFCLNYADIPESAIPYDCATTTWIDSLSARGMYAPAGSYDPKPGDLIFFDWEGDGLSDHVGIVWAVNPGSITTIEGNHTISVELFDYDLSDGHIQGYGILPENPALAVTDSEENVSGDKENPDEAEGGAASAAGASDGADASNNSNNNVDTENTEKTEPDPETLAKMPPFNYSERVAGIRVSIEADAGAFPEGTTVEIKAIEDDGLAEQVAPVVNGKVVQVQAVDITFYDAEGNEIEPRIPIRVTMRPNTETDEANSVEVVHVDSEGNVNAVTPDAGIAQPDKGAAFDADSFSPYVLVYVLKFDYPVNGKTYESELAGGEDLLLSDLLVQLGVCEEGEVSEFVSKIDSVTASDPEALSVSEKEGVWTVRPMKDSEGELSLAVEMQDGAKFSVQVQATGKTEVSSEDNNTVITAVNDLYLPENAVTETAVLTEAESTEAIAAVEKAVEQETQEPASVTENAPKETENETPAAVSQVAYQVFSISLEGVEYSKYEDGFQVSLTLPEGIAGKDFEVYHIDNDGNAQKLEIETDAHNLTEETQLVSTVSFVTPSFSDFVIRYTVDFHYKVNGNYYEFSFTGGSFVSLEKLLELLQIPYAPEPELEPVYAAEPATAEQESGETGSTDIEITDTGLSSDSIGSGEASEPSESVASSTASESEAKETRVVYNDLSGITVSDTTRKFVANISSVTFTNPDLIWVGKAEEETTVGALREANTLAPEYSAELTEEQIAEIDSQTITAGDWALISLKPFQSEESLIITMNNGYVYKIRVTDVQIKYNNIKNAFTNDPAYSQYYNSSSPIGIAGSFHIVAFDTVTLNVHTNGNVLAQNLIAKANFGTNPKAYTIPELSYIQNYIQVNGSSASTDDGLLVLGDNKRDPAINIIGYVDNESRFSVNGTKLDKPLHVIQDSDTTQYPFIDLSEVKTAIESLSSSLKTTGDTVGVRDKESNDNVEVNISDDQNNRYIKLKGEDIAGYVNVSANEMNSLGVQEQTIKIIGFGSGHTGSVIINVDCSGVNEVTLPNAIVYLDGNEVSCSETVDFSGGKVIWNFVNADGVKINTSRMTGIIIAPNSDVDLRYSYNGTVVANNVENHTETHRTDFTGTTNPTQNVLTALKFVDGATPSYNDRFTFILEELQGGKWKEIDRKQNTGGLVLFDNQTYTQAGSFWYYIHESNTGTEDNSFYFDNSGYLVNVIIVADGNGNMVVSATNKYLLSADTAIKDLNSKSLIQSAIESGGITSVDKVTFRNYSGTTSLKVKKTWRGQATASILVSLYRTEGTDLNTRTQVGVPVTLSSENSWKYTFDNLPKYKVDELTNTLTLDNSGNPILYKYTVEEEVPEGYTSSISYSSDGTEATITNSKSEVINISLEKKWTDETVATPPENASATFTVHQLKSTRIGSSGDYTVELLGPDKVTVLGTRLANVGDAVSFSGKAPAWTNDSMDIYRDHSYGYNWDYCGGVQASVNQDFSFTYVIGKDDIKDNKVQIAFRSQEFLNNCTEAPAWDVGDASYSDYAPTEYIKTISLPVNGEWSTTIQNLIKMDEEGNLYSYYITEDSCTPKATATFLDNLGQDIEHAVASNGKVVVTNTYEKEKGSLKIEKKVTVDEKPINDSNKSLTNGTYTFEIWKSDGTTRVLNDVNGDQLPSLSITYTDGVPTPSSELQIDNLEPGEYIIKETGSTNAYMKLDTTVPNYDSSAKGIRITVTANNASDIPTAAFTNNYRVSHFEFTKKWLDIAGREISWDQDIQVTVHRMTDNNTTDPNFALVYNIPKTEIADGAEFSTTNATDPKLRLTVTTTEDEKPLYVFKLENLDNEYIQADSKWKYTYFATETNGLIAGYKNPTYSNENAPSSDKAFDKGVIRNAKDSGYELPQTGGPGTALYGLLGGLMVVTAGAVLTLRRKKNKA